MLTPIERERYKELHKYLSIWVLHPTEREKELRENRTKELELLQSKMNLISLGQYLKLKDKPKIAHLPDDSFCSGQTIDYVTDDYWTKTGGQWGRSWCNHGGTLVEIID